MKAVYNAVIVVESGSDMLAPTALQLDAWAIRNGLDLTASYTTNSPTVMFVDLSKDLKKPEGVSDEKENSIRTEKEYDCATDCCCEENRRKQKCRGEQSVQAGEGFGDSEKPYELPHHPV